MKIERRFFRMRSHWNIEENSLIVERVQTLIYLLFCNYYTTKNLIKNPNKGEQLYKLKKTV